MKFIVEIDDEDWKSIKDEMDLDNNYSDKDIIDLLINEKNMYKVSVEEVI